eukprot:TRINITY_DN114279_c0_g1_i1.p1 TRINITY_DN114279_c0_g1~~TRINITY_DN114279_c0_g1_i1.p1  ORF type:complete len:375 (-),score=56.62 TRINITY_DN114279_c0_g1_i1:74-1198(-)
MTSQEAEKTMFFRPRQGRTSRPQNTSRRDRFSCLSVLLATSVVVATSFGVLQSASFVSSSANISRFARDGDRKLVARKARTAIDFDEEAWLDDGPDRLSIEDLEIGQELTAVVLKVKPFGFFVDVGADRDGLVPLSQISRNHIANIEDVAEAGDTLKVWVSDLADGKITLTMIESDGKGGYDPGIDFSEFESVSTDDWLDAEIEAVEAFGAFVRVFPPKGGEPSRGFVHVSNLQDNFVEHPSFVVKVGQAVKVRLVDLDRSSGRMTLSMRENFVVSRRRPAEMQDVSSFVGLSKLDWFEGRVDHVTTFGVFVEVDPLNSGTPVQGLVHVTEIRDGYVDDPGALVEVEQKVKVRILDADVRSGRISLSMRKPSEP